MQTINMMLAALLEALTAEIRKAGKGEDYCSITVQPGNAVVFDFGPESGCGGIAWVRLVSGTPSLSPGGGKQCNRWMTYIVEMGMVGPAPVMTNTLGEFVAPEDTELFEAAMRQGDELELMFAALQAVDLPELEIGDYLPQGPEGGVMGGTFTATIAGV